MVSGLGLCLVSTDTGADLRERCSSVIVVASRRESLARSRRVQEGPRGFHPRAQCDRRIHACSAVPPPESGGLTRAITARVRASLSPRGRVTLLRRSVRSAPGRDAGGSSHVVTPSRSALTV